VALSLLFPAAADVIYAQPSALEKYTQTCEYEASQILASYTSNIRGCCVVTPQTRTWAFISSAVGGFTA
jgi:hypothetical protein